MFIYWYTYSLYIVYLFIGSHYWYTKNHSSSELLKLLLQLMLIWFVMVSDNAHNWFIATVVHLMNLNLKCLILFCVFILSSISYFKILVHNIEIGKLDYSICLLYLTIDKHIITSNLHRNSQISNKIVQQILKFVHIETTAVLWNCELKSN